MAAIVELIAAKGLEVVAYQSPAGPITPLDMLYGHRPAIARGNAFMAHHTAFTDERLGGLLLAAGFASVNTLRAPSFDLWAIAFREQASPDPTLDLLAAHGLGFRA